MGVLVFLLLIIKRLVLAKFLFFLLPLLLGKGDEPFIPFSLWRFSFVLLFHDLCTSRSRKQLFIIISYLLEFKIYVALSYYVNNFNYIRIP